MLGWFIVVLCALALSALLAAACTGWFRVRRDGRCRIVFFDGDCGLCGRVVRFLLRADRRGLLRFAPLQGNTARQLLPEGLRREALESTLVYYREGPDRGAERLVRDKAVLAVLDDLGGPLRLLTLGRVLPGAWRRGLYDRVARNRGRLAPAACEIPANGGRREDRILP